MNAELILYAAATLASADELRAFLREIARALEPTGETFDAQAWLPCRCGDGSCVLCDDEGLIPCGASS